MANRGKGRQEEGDTRADRDRGVQEQIGMDRYRAGRDRQKHKQSKADKRPGDKEQSGPLR